MSRRRKLRRLFRCDGWMDGPYLLGRGWVDTRKRRTQGKNAGHNTLAGRRTRRHNRRSLGRRPPVCWRDEAHREEKREREGTEWQFCCPALTYPGHFLPFLGQMSQPVRVGMRDDILVGTFKLVWVKAWVKNDKLPWPGRRQNARSLVTRVGARTRAMTECADRHFLD